MGNEQVDRLRRMPAYPFIEAAHYLNMPVSRTSPIRGSGDR